ncbi:MAG: SURF1 family protein [Gammaproteobacteria bacterium]
MNKDRAADKPLSRRAHLRRSFIATAFLLAGLLVFVSAGRWQLNRAGEKEYLQASFAAGTLVEEVSELVDGEQKDDYRYRRFRLSGAYDSAQQILLDNMVADGQVGYQVLTPMRLDSPADDRWVLVNRGWVPADPSRITMPDVSIAATAQEIKGRLELLPRPGIQLATPQEVLDSGDWPRQLSFPTAPEISQVLARPVTDYQILLDQDQPEGYRRDWRSSDMGPERHLGYALQWFAFAALALVIYVVLNMRWAKQTKIV